MSSFMVTDQTINNIVSYLAIKRYNWIVYRLKEEMSIDLTTRDGKEAFGKALFQLNIDGVNARYGENEAQEFRSLNYKYVSQIPCSNFQALKSLTCLLYQACEGNVPDSTFYKLMLDFKHSMMSDIIHCLPQYEAARWD